MPSDLTLIGAIKSAGSGFEGWASTSQLDRQGDVVLPSAFTKSLDAFRANGPIYWNHAEVHDPLAMPIGTTTEATIRDGGLYIKGRWATTALAQEVRSLVVEGIVKTMSIGYNPAGDGYMKGGNHVVDDLELMEVSIVAIPANPGAVITAAKALDTFAEVIPADAVTMTVMHRGDTETPVVVRERPAAADVERVLATAIKSDLRDQIVSLQPRLMVPEPDIEDVRLAVDMLREWLDAESPVLLNTRRIARLKGA